MERKPVIGVTINRRKDNPEEVAVSEGIRKAVETLGGEVRAIDYTKLKAYELLGEAVQIDGMIYSGGSDVDPSFYGEDAEPACGAVDRKRDDIEINLFPLLLTRSTPILAICRGCQVVNVAFGGTLYQDLPTDCQVNHRQDDANGRFSHTVSIEPGTRLSEIVGSSELPTNSYHHQSVKEVAPGFIVNARTPDGVIEGIESSMGTFIMGVQWHPEVTLDADTASLKIFEAFMDAVKKRMNAPCHED